MSYTEYTKTVWQNGQSYGEEAFNNIEGGIKNLENLVLEGGIGSGGGGASASYGQKQNLNMSVAMNKLKFGKVPVYNTDTKKTTWVDAITEFAFMGDSVFWGFNTLESDTSRLPATCVDDMGNSLSGFFQSDIRIPNEFRNIMRAMYGNSRVNIKDKTYTGMDGLRALAGYNATGSDFVFINYGINDAVGGHVSKSYLGWISEFVPTYRKIVEKQIDGGSAVIIVGPVKQTLVGPTLDGDGVLGSETTSDQDSRMMVELYEQALKDIAHEYNCPFLSGDDLTRDFDNTFSIDFTHFIDDAYSTMAARLAAPFIGATSPNHPNRILASTYLGVNPQLDGIKLSNGAVVEFSDLSPNYPISLQTSDLYAAEVIRNTGGSCAKVRGFGKVSWSFYAEQDGMVVIPNFYSDTPNIAVDMKLDFGYKQGKWANYWNSVSSTSIDRDYVEPTSVTIPSSSMEVHGAGRRYGLHSLTNASQPNLKIVSKGWHTITLEVTPAGQVAYSGGVMPASIPTPNENHTFFAFGINILSNAEYKALVG